MKIEVAKINNKVVEIVVNNKEFYCDKCQQLNPTCFKTHKHKFLFNFSILKDNEVLSSWADGYEMSGSGRIRYLTSQVDISNPNTIDVADIERRIILQTIKKNIFKYKIFDNYDFKEIQLSDLFIDLLPLLKIYKRSLFVTLPHWAHLIEEYNSFNVRFNWHNFNKTFTKVSEYSYDNEYNYVKVYIGKKNIYYSEVNERKTIIIEPRDWCVAELYEYYNNNEFKARVSLLDCDIKDLLLYRLDKYLFIPSEKVKLYADKYKEVRFPETIKILKGEITSDNIIKRNGSPVVVYNDNSGILVLPPEYNEYAVCRISVVQPL